MYAYMYTTDQNLSHGLWRITTLQYSVFFVLNQQYLQCKSVIWQRFSYCQLRARRALSIFKDVLFRTRRALSLYKVYGDSALLVLNGTSLISDSALLVLNWWYLSAAASVCTFCEMKLQTAQISYLCHGMIYTAWGDMMRSILLHYSLIA